MSSTRWRNPPRPRVDSRAHAHHMRRENREFVRLLLVVAGLMIGAVLVVDRAAVWLAQRVPFAAELELARATGLDRLPVTLLGAGRAPTEAGRAIEAALQARVNALARVLDVPPEVVLTVHYVDTPMVNAVATLGGHITMFRGLLSRLESNDELDAVLAHEIGHVRERHVIRHMSRGVSAALVLGMIGVRSATLNGWLVGDAQQLLMLAHSRDAERESDAAATHALLTRYGHPEGIVKLFERFDALQRERPDARGGVEVLHSHPLPATRRDAVLALRKPGAVLTPLDPVYLGARSPAPRGDGPQAAGPESRQVR